MASVPRDFMADEPVLATARCVLRVRFMERPAMKTEIRRAVAKWAGQCRVDVMGWTVAGNHLHFLLSQEHTGHDRARRVGISAFLRNVFSSVARYGNGLHSSQGRFFERTFYSRNRPSAEQALQSLGYILEHPVKHGFAGGFDDENTSGRLYRRGTADGVATAVLGLFLQRDPELRWNAIVNLFEEMYADPRWRENGVEVAREAIQRHPEVVDKKGWNAPIAVALWAGEEAAKRAREAVLTAPQVRVKFRSRNSPAPGDVITVVFEELPPIYPSMASAADSS
jgi:REP element-mobilizing transposase RayT